jgi:SAM-dependent methyltransferase
MVFLFSKGMCPPWSLLTIVSILSSRYLLMHLPEPEAVLKEMLRVCKSGGAVAVQEPDFSFQRCYPDSWAYERLPGLFSRLFPDAFLGPKLWSLFEKLGYKLIQRVG